MKLNVPAELVPLIVPRSCPDQLTGTFKQVTYAESVRRSMLARARVQAPELVGLLLNVRDATWFLGNKTRPLSQLRYPKPEQMRGPEINLFIDGTSSPEVVISASSVKANRHGGDRGDRESPVSSAASLNAPGPTRNLAGRHESVAQFYRK